MPTKQEVALIKLQEFVDIASGPIRWTGTKLSGYASTGPYHCQDCKYLQGRTDGKIFRDPLGRGRCNNIVMMADPQVEHEQPPQIENATNRDIEKPQPAIVDIARGCCEFVDNDIRMKKQ